MAKFFGVDIQAEISKAIGPADLPPITLRKWTVGTRNPVDLNSGTNPISVDYVTRGIVSAYTTRDIADTGTIQAGDKKVMMIAKPFADAGIVPDLGDEVIAEGVTLRIVAPVVRDPATATYECQCRG